MPDTTLGPSSYIVLGMLAQFGPATSYDIKRWADGSVGFFWSFPRSQLYAEPQRLAASGLVVADQEDSGRRRRTFAITDAGRAALRDWLHSPAGFPELRDAGLLRLFFAGQGGDGTASAIAHDQLIEHRARLATYESLRAAHDAGEVPLDTRTTLSMGLAYERAAIAFWTDVLEDTPAGAEGESRTG